MEEGSLLNSITTLLHDVVKVIDAIQAVASNLCSLQATVAPSVTSTESLPFVIRIALQDLKDIFDEIKVYASAFLEQCSLMTELTEEIQMTMDDLDQEKIGKLEVFLKKLDRNIDYCKEALTTFNEEYKRLFAKIEEKEDRLMQDEKVAREAYRLGLIYIAGSAGAGGAAAGTVCFFVGVSILSGGPAAAAILCALPAAFMALNKGIEYKRLQPYIEVVGRIVPEIRDKVSACDKGLKNIHEASNKICARLSRDLQIELRSIKSNEHSKSDVVPSIKITLKRLGKKLSTLSDELQKLK